MLGLAARGVTFRTRVSNMFPKVERIQACAKVADRSVFRYLSVSASCLSSAVTGKGERRRVRSFRRDYVPLADQRAVRLPTSVDDGDGIPVDILVPWIDMVEKGVQAMVSSNPGLRIERKSPTALTVHTTDTGEFQVYLEETGARLVIMSPAKTGTLAHYHWNPLRDQFVSIIDGHNALELLARDLIFTLRGVPDF